METYSTTTYSDPSAGILAGVSSALFIIAVILVVLNILAYWKIFEKAGENGWKSIIPFYNTYTMFKISWGKGLYFFLTFIPFVGIVFEYIALYKLCRCFEKSVGFFVGLLFIRPVFLLIMAFDSSEYTEPEGEIED